MMGRIIFLNWDSKHFGLKIGKYIPTEVEKIRYDLDVARKEGYDLLISRIPIENINIANSLEKYDFELKDTLIQYEINIENQEILLKPGKFKIRSAEDKDILAVEKVAMMSFENYIGHFHRDKRLNNTKCTELYVKWAINSLKNKELADVVFVAEDDSDIIGFGTIKIISKDGAQGILFATRPDSRRKGVFTVLIQNSVAWCKNQGIRKFIYGTQIDNYPVHRVLAKIGGKICEAYYTFHWWRSEHEN